MVQRLTANAAETMRYSPKANHNIRDDRHSAVQGLTAIAADANPWTALCHPSLIFQLTFGLHPVISTALAVNP